MCSATPCVAEVSGSGISCANLDASLVSGTTFGGGFPALDTSIGDIATIFQFVIQ